MMYMLRYLDSYFQGLRLPEQIVLQACPSYTCNRCTQHRTIASQSVASVGETLSVAPSQLGCGDTVVLQATLVHNARVVEYQPRSRAFSRYIRQESMSKSMHQDSAALNVVFTNPGLHHSGRKMTVARPSHRLSTPLQLRIRPRYSRATRCGAQNDRADSARMEHCARQVCRLPCR
jgi:hypothetical protein